jgi:hypothetical protein
VFELVSVVVFVVAPAVAFVRLVASSYHEGRSTVVNPTFEYSIDSTTRTVFSFRVVAVKTSRY